MSALPNLYLKWGVFKALFVLAQSDAKIAKTIFGNVDGAAILFSRLLYGDASCPPDVAAELVKLMNSRIDLHLRERGLPQSGSNRIMAGDLLLPVYEFTRRLVAAAEQIDADQLDVAHRELLKLMAPAVKPQEMPRLAVKRFAVDRMIGSDWLPSKSREDDRIVFEPGHHAGQIVVEGLAQDPVATYAFLMRDPHSLGRHLWELNWSETVLWLPSPLKAVRAGETLNLMPMPQPVQPVPGRFLVTAVLVLDQKAVGDLDPRGSEAHPGALDEQQTARFLTNMRRLSKSKSSPIRIMTGEYDVVLPGPG
jgi:hypothetical protein